MEKGFRLMEEDFAEVNKDLDVVHTCMENADNLMRKNNLRMRGLKEYIGEENLILFLEQFFSSLENLQSQLCISIQSAFWLAP